MFGMMIWLIYSRLGPVIAWIWRISRTFLVTPLLSPVVRSVRLALGWRLDPGSRGEPGINGGGEAGTVGDPEHGTYLEQGPQEEEEEEEERVDTTDEFYCGYDSTWESERREEEEEEEERGVMKRSSLRTAAAFSEQGFKFRRFENAAKDMWNYRHDYCLQTRQHRWNKNMLPDEKPNLGFYLGQRPSSPDGVYIYDFHNNWKGNYDMLEHVHTFIQWLFPLPEAGMNHEALPLTKEEIKDFRDSDTAKENLLQSYKLMLDFYGIELCDENTGEIQRALNWEDRFYNLNKHSHNNLRITRILKCLGILGFPHFQAPLVHLLLKETLIHGVLPNVKDGVLNYFVFAVRDKKQRRNLIKFAYLNYESKDEFVWCPRRIQTKWLELSASKPRKRMDALTTSHELVSELSLSLDTRDKANEAVKVESV